jgi:hypothetical protein
VVPDSSRLRKAQFQAVILLEMQTPNGLMAQQVEDT